MIIYKKIENSELEIYDKIPMLVDVRSILKVEEIDGGLGGLLLKEVPVQGYIKDLGKEEIISDLEDRFDISNWAFWIAFDGKMPVGGAAAASRTKGVDMLDGRDDMSVLWDIRVDDGYKNIGIGSKLFDFAVEWSRNKGFVQMKIECQNNNVAACRFYRNKGAVLCKVDEYAYYDHEECRDEVQLIWYLDL
jgi:GNAT superfamily N-acetyltransferase